MNRQNMIKQTQDFYLNMKQLILLNKNFIPGTTSLNILAYR